ncbi:MAG: YciI family protein [Parvularculaceae bacterium]
MPQFILLCRDRDGALPLRLETRPKHLEYFNSYGNKLILGGPMLNGAGDPVGSMIIIEAQTEAAAHEIAAGDPYQLAGVFETVEVIPFRTVIANFPEKA